MSGMAGGSFMERHGRLRILGRIGMRRPVVPPAKFDRNRRLMIKFKYGCLNKEEETQFHEDMKKLIYKAMHRGTVQMDWDDLYQEIWRKIVKSRHSWNESNGTMVSTWITIVAMSVMNTMRKRVNAYNSRYVAYEDAVGGARSDDDGPSQNEACDIIAGAIPDEAFEGLLMHDQYDRLIESLSPSERAFMDAARQAMGMDGSDGRKGRLSFGELRSRLGYTQPEFNQVLHSVRDKIQSFFPGMKRKQEEAPAAAEEAAEENGMIMLF